MFKLKKSMKKVIGLALAGVILVGSTQTGVKVNAAGGDSDILDDTPSVSNPVHKYAYGLETFDALKVSVKHTTVKWSDVKNSVNKNLLGVIGGKNYGRQAVNPIYFQNSNNSNKITSYNYYCIANDGPKVYSQKGENGETLYAQERRVYLKDFGMATSKKNHFPEINDPSKWSIELLTRGEVTSYEWGKAKVTLLNKLTCQKCKYVDWTEGPCSDTDKVLPEHVKGENRIEDVDIKHYSCNKCGKQGNWKVSSELELQHDVGTKPAIILVYEKNVPKKNTAKFGTINFYGYANAVGNDVAGLSSSVPGNFDLTGRMNKSQSAEVTVKKGKKLYYSDVFRAPATFKTSKSSVVSVSNKMGSYGYYTLTAKKKGTATVTATSIWGQKFTFKITVK